MRTLVLTLALIATALVSAEISYSPEQFPLILQDIYQQLEEEERTVDFEQLTADLTQLAENPVNINAATEADLRQLLFLSDEQIDAILLFVYRSPLHSLSELRLVNCLAEYDIRNLLPFIYVGSIGNSEPFYFKEMWHLARQETYLRFDARNIENEQPDPFFLSFKYKFNYRNKVDFGLVAERDPHEPFYYKDKTYGADFYGGWLQINDLWRFKSIVVGDYRASFGQGLVINTNLAYGGKAAYLYQRGLREEGIKRKSSAAEYGFLRGTAATLRLGIADLTLLYSARKLDGNVTDNVFPSIQTTGYHRTESELAAKRSVWQQVVAANLTLNLKRLKLGLTASENLLSDTLRPRPLYYNANYFQGVRQAAVGLNYDWQIWRLHLFGEIATTQNSRWGLANLTGIRISPLNFLTVSALYRYYSPHFDNLLASSFSESSKINDENGVYLGVETSLLRKWKFALYADWFHFSAPKYDINRPSSGFEVYTTADFIPSSSVSMQWKFRTKSKGDQNKYSLRYLLKVQGGSWLSTSGVETNLVVINNPIPTFGGVVYQQFDYHWLTVPISLQARLEAFYAPDYQNRLYAYENDVLYAFSIPQIYGIGGRWYLNFRYHINKYVSLYLKAAQTVFSDETVQKRALTSKTRTEIHSSLRIHW